MTLVAVAPRTNEWMGWRKNLPDYRDEPYRYGVALKHEMLSAGATPKWAAPQRKEVDAHGVMNQGPSGSCTGHGVGLCAAVERNVGMRSAYAIYYEARRKIGETDVDNGAYVRDAADVTANYGAPRYDLWPNDSDKLFVDPVSKVDRDATKRKLFTYHSLQGRDQILSCLTGGHLIAFGFSVFSNIDDPITERFGLLQMPGGSMEGGHCVAGIGFNLDFRNSEWGQWARNQGVADSMIPAEVIECQNSWDYDWGRNGRFVVPIDFACNPDLADDFVTLRGFARDDV